MKKRIIIVSIVLIVCSIFLFGKDTIMNNIKKMTTDVTVTPEEEYSCTVIYTDGVAYDSVFPDQEYEGLKSGDYTPAFVEIPGKTQVLEDGTVIPIREGYTFMGWAPSKNPIVYRDDANDDGNIIYTATWQKEVIRGIEKELVESNDDVPSNINVSGITYPNNDGKIIIPAGSSGVSLLYSITVTGTPGIKYRVTDTGATYVGGDPLTGTLSKSGEAVIYVVKMFTEFDINEDGKLINTVTVTPGKGDEPSSSSAETTPAEVEEVDKYAAIIDKLNITKNASNTTPLVGEEFRYTIKIENPNEDLIMLDVSDVLPDSLTFVSASDGGIEKDGVVTWENVRVPGKGYKEVILTVKANQATTVENTATIHLNNLTKLSNTEVITSEETTKYTVIYKDEDDSFPVQTTKELLEGENTPKFKEEPGKTETLEDGTVIPIREGYRFIGWSKRINKVVSSEDANENYEIIYIAKWQKMGEATDKEENTISSGDNTNKKNSNEIQIPLTEDKIIKYLIVALVSTSIFVVVLLKSKRIINQK